MKTPLPDVVAALLLGAAAAANAVAGVNPSEWPRQLDVPVATPGLTRLELPPAALASTRADRGDLRLLDPEGQEVPWRLHRAIAAEPPRALLAAGRIAARIEDRRSVLEFETGTGRPLAGLRIATSASGFFKAATLDAQRDGGWERLATGIPLYRDYQGATELRIDFSPGSWRRMRITLDDRRSSPIPVQSVDLFASPANPIPITPVPAVVRARSEDGGTTRLHVDLGAAGLDVAWIELETPEPLFTRPVRVQSEHVAGDALLTEDLVRSVVHRVPGDPREAEESRRIRVERQVPTREVVLLVDNGDSPPLAATAVRVGLHPQRVEFWAVRAGTHRLLSGNAFATAPRYDISRLALPQDVAPVELVAPAAWTANPAYREAGVGPDFLGIGAPFAPKGWRHARRLSAAAGSAELELPADVVAAARPDLGDLRIVRSGRQVPYVVDRQRLVRALPVAVNAEPRRDGSRRSAWRLETQKGVAAAVLRLDTPQAAFSRGVRWVEMAEGRDGARWTNVLASAEWTRVPGAAAKPLALVPSAAPRGGTSWVEVEDGDNPPLPALTAAAEYATARLLFLSPGGDALELHYGNPEAVAPRYDLAVLADRLNASTRSAATLGPAEAARREWDDMLGSGPVVQVVFWAVLAGVVGVLFVVIRRTLPAPPDGA